MESLPVPVVERDGTFACMLLPSPVSPLDLSTASTPSGSSCVQGGHESAASGCEEFPLVVGEMKHDRYRVSSKKTDGCPFFKIVLTHTLKHFNRLCGLLPSTVVHSFLQCGSDTCSLKFPPWQWGDSAEQDRLAFFLLEFTYLWSEREVNKRSC